MNKLILLILTVLFSNSIFGQNCYIQLSDMSGFDTSPYQDELETAARELRSSLPEQYRDQFKVYDFGFYSITEFTSGGFEEVWDKIKLDVQQQSPYYLLFGKITTSIEGIYSQIWVDFKLPDISDGCFVRDAFIYENLTQILNTDLSPYTYANREIQAMQTVSMLGCEICDNGIDDDGDGYIDCYDLDCISTNESLKNRIVKSRRSEICYLLSETCVSSIDLFIKNTENDQWLKENLEVLDWGLSFMSEYGCPEEIGNFVLEAFNLKKTDEEIVLERVEELYLELKANPNSLIDSCPDFDLQTYSDLLNLEIPSSIINQLDSYGLCGTVDPTTTINTLSPCFGIQPIEDGSSALVNIDYYAVEINQIPDFDNDGIPDTKEQLYQEFRDSFVKLASGMTTISSTNCPSPLDVVTASWQFSPYQQHIDLPLWESRSIGARFFIDANAQEVLAKLIADDGAIITIQENELNFVISTIYTPRSSSQPFSGKRMWGIRTNNNGNCEIFTRAIDRAKPIPIINLFGEVPGFTDCDDLDYFDIADRTWTNLQSNVNQFISNNGGMSTIKNPQFVHLDFKKVYDKLKSDEPVSFISCQ